MPGSLDFALMLRGLTQSRGNSEVLRIALGELGSLYIISDRHAVRTRMDPALAATLASRLPIRREACSPQDSEFVAMAALEQDWSGLLWAVGHQHSHERLFPWVVPKARFSLRALPALGTVHLSEVDKRLAKALWHSPMPLAQLVQTSACTAHDAIRFVNAASLAGSLTQLP